MFSTNWQLLSSTLVHIPGNLIGQAYFSSKATKTMCFWLVSGCTLSGQLYTFGPMRLNHFPAWVIRCEGLWAGSQATHTRLVHEATAATLIPMLFISPSPAPEHGVTLQWLHPPSASMFLPDQTTSLTFLSYVSLLDVTKHLQNWLICPCLCLDPKGNKMSLQCPSLQAVPLMLLKGKKETPCIFPEILL